MNHFIYSLISFIIALFFIMLGVISALMPWFPAMRADLIQFLLENSIAIFLFGMAFLTIGVCMVVNIILHAKKHYYEFTVGEHPVRIEEDLIQKYLQTYFQNLFPAKEVPCHLSIKQNRLYITADLPPVPSSQRDIIIEKIQQDLKKLFSEHLGYHSEYYLSASFQADPK